MPQFPQQFSARTVEPIGTLQQLPVSDGNGWPVVITKSEMQATANNPNNGMLCFTLQIIEGDHKGEEGIYRLNLYHENAKTVEIANRQLSSVCWVCNKPDAKLSEELHNIPFRAVVTAQTGEGKENYTQIKGVKDINGNDPGKTGNVIQPAAPAPTPGAPAWTPPSAPAAAETAAAAAPAWGGAAAPGTAAPAKPPWAS